MLFFTVARCRACLLGSVLAYSATVANMSARVDSWPLMLPVWVVVVSMLCVSPIGWFGLGCSGMGLFWVCSSDPVLILLLGVRLRIPIRTLLLFLLCVFRGWLVLGLLVLFLGGF